MSVLDLPALVVGAMALGLILHVAWYDFRHLTIRNSAVLLLLALYGLYAALTGFSALASDLAAGVVLFVPGLVMWLMRLMGAGDVKLYFALGLFIGLDRLWLFAVLLLGVSVMFLIALQAARIFRNKSVLWQRLGEIRTSGKAPYAVIMGAAAIPVILLRLFSQA
ncbi:pilus assembly protein CpaA [Roseovarius faecimaris]|uniref:Pilus assembly protein CpaA n=1 Tax=Roseovarius faecimaris TaxID=2494550 RepID=A0A6I6ISZ6_9RHOB|nr:prepilin peptidase [Roseovarius faecimaris]QGY00200.1 pilus assembly protein CpaA [Roseovarius faecimaris]